MNDPNEKLERIVSDAMARQLRGGENAQSELRYESIDQYTQATGKRFRMTKDQKARNISREEAFQEFLRNLG